MSGTAACTLPIAALTCAIASAPAPARPNWWSMRSGEHSWSTTLASPAAKPSSNMRCITVKASDLRWPGAGGADGAGTDMATS